jgi:hypothetical protein
VQGVLAFDPAVLWLCLALFIARVLGQIFVGLYRPRFLPPWEEWYSGVLPYPWLLLSQVLIIMWLTLAAYDSTRGSGFFVLENPRTARGIYVASLFYGGGMILRYAITMWRSPERRWFKGTIPIWFHLVLAAFLLFWSR